MRNLLIALSLGATGLTFYSALAHKSEKIEQDITARVTEDLTANRATGVRVDVDGRHVTLSGIVYDEKQEAAYLKTANDTYGALGPIDGLTYQGDGGYISAEKTETGIALRGSVPNEAVRASLLETAAKATEGEIDDQLTIAGPEAPWQSETAFGVAQLAGLQSGTITTSASGNVLSGVTEGDVAAVRDPVSERAGWRAFVSSPGSDARLQEEITSLRAKVAESEATLSGLRDAARDKEAEIAALAATGTTLQGERDALQARVTSLKDDLSDELVTGEGLRAKLRQAEEDLAAAQETIQTKEASLAETSQSLVSRAVEADGQLSVTANALTEAQTEVAALTSRLADKEAQIAEQSDALTDRGLQIDALQAQIATQTADLSVADQEIASLQTSLEARTAEVTKAEAENYMLSATAAGRDSTIARLNAELAERSQVLRSENSTASALAATLDQRDAALAELEGTVARKDAELDTLTAQLSAMEITIATRDTDLTALRGEWETASATLAEKDASLANFSSEIKDLDATLEVRNVSLAKAITQITALKRETHSLKDQVGRLEDDIKARDATLAAQTEELAARNSAQNADADTLDADLRALETTIAARDAALAEASTEIAGLKDAAAANAQATAAQLKALEAQVAQRDTALTQAEAEIAALSSSSAQEHARLGDLNGQVAALTETLSARDATIAAFQSRPENTSIAAQCAQQAKTIMEDTQIKFGSGTARFKRASLPVLERLTGVALACVGSDVSVEIGGHTDNEGSDKDNQKLSEARAKAVLSFMQKRGVPVESLRAVGYGETQPVAENNTVRGRAANRRITFNWQAR